MGGFLCAHSVLCRMPISGRRRGCVSAVTCDLATLVNWSEVK